MAPEETFNQQAWEVLQNIKEEYLATVTGKPVKYRIPIIVGVGIIPPDRRIKILYKLQEEKAFEIQRNAEGVRIGARDIFYLIINPSKFNEVYEKYKKACDPNAYLNDYQQRLIEGSDKDNLPQFSRTEIPIDKEIDKWLAGKDERTIRRIWQVVSAINYEWQLRDQDSFQLPHDKFERAKITNTNDLEAILTSLHNKKLIFVSRKVAEQPPSDDPANKPGGMQLWQSITEDPGMIRLNDTQIKIFPERFVYLRDNLKKKLVLKKNKPASTTKALKKQEAEQALRPTGFNPKSILPVNPSAEKIFKSFSSYNYPFILMVLKGILSLIDFSSDGKIHYQLQSPAGQLLMNERSLLSKLNIEGLFSYYGEDDIFGIVTLGNINIDILKQLESYIIKAMQGSKQVSGEIPPDSSGRKGLEKKWDVLQAIWTIYESNSRPDSLLLPSEAVAVKGRNFEEIDGIIDGLKNSGNFARWERKDRYYNLEEINHELLPETYRQIKLAYEGPTENHLQKNVEETSKWDSKLPNKREMAKEVTKLTKVCKLGKKEEKLLRILSNFEPKRTKELTNEIPTKDYKHLKSALASKIIKNGWDIKPDKGKGLNPDSFYTLIRATPIKN